MLNKKSQAETNVDSEQMLGLNPSAKMEQIPMLAAVYISINDAVANLGLSKRVKWKNYLGYLCRYTKKSICPEFVIQNGLPVQINGS